MMVAKNKIAVAVLIFGVAALMGPLVRWLTWPPSAFEQSTSIALATFVSDLVFLLWPSQPLAVVEVNSGPALAAVLTVGLNVLLFVGVGAVAGFLARMHFWLVTLYLGVGLSLGVLALWGAGFSVAHLNVTALIVALLLYAVPFVLTARLTRVAD